jgi:hypothetical protein
MDGVIGELTFKECGSCIHSDTCLQEFLHDEDLNEHISFNAMDEMICKNFEENEK